MRLMYIARLVCSDEACAEEVTLEAATLAELETLICDCGCALELIGWPDVAAEPLAEVIMLRVQAATAARRRGDVPEAA